MARRTVGIDLAIRGFHVATILDEQGQVIGAPIRFRLIPEDLARVVHAVWEGLKPDDEVLVVLEPTGMAWFPVAQWFTRAGCTVIRVKGQRVKALRRYLSEHAKSDVVDAHVLGSIPGFGGKGLQPLFLPTSQQHALNRLTNQRRRYQEEVGSIHRRLKSLVRWAHPALEGALGSLKTTVSLAVLERYFNPHRMRRLGRKRLAAFLRKHVCGVQSARGPFAEELAKQLIEAARETIRLYPEEDVDFDLLQLEVGQEIQRLRLHRELMGRLDEEIERLYRSLHPTDHLRTIPGLGVLLGPSLLGLIHTWQRFGTQQRLRGFTGLFPRRHESGGRDSPSQRITRAGNDRLKRDLILAADVARKIDPELARVYHTMMVVKGKRHLQALCAVATRLTNRIYTVLKESRSYVLRDLDGRPITVAEARAIVNAQFQVPDDIRQARRKGKPIAA